MIKDNNVSNLNATSFSVKNSSHVKEEGSVMFTKQFIFSLIFCQIN